MFFAKLKASLLHLLASSFIVGSFVGFALLVWYPPPFLQLSGLLPILVLLASVDLILGPLLTFVVYKPVKPSLLMDLSIICVVQISALSYGMYTIYKGHPAYVAYTVDRFTLVNIADVNPTKAKNSQLQVSGWWRPLMVYAKPPSDPKEQERLVFEVLSGKPDIDARPEYYEPFDKFTGEIMQKGLTQHQLSSTPENQQKLNTFLTKYGKTATNYAFLPLVGKEKDVLWAWDRKTGKPVGILDIDPWKQASQVATSN